MSADDSLPDDIETLKSMLIAERAARMAAEGEAQHRALLIEKLKYTIKKLQHERFGQSAERGELIEQLELQLADLETPRKSRWRGMRKQQRAPPFRCRRLNGASQRGVRYPNTCHASASSIQR